MEHRLINGEIDVAIMVSNALSEPQAMVCETLTRSPNRVELPSNHALAAQGEVSLADCAACDQIVLEADRIDGLMNGVWARHPLMPRAILRTASLEAVRALVGAGAGIAVLPDILYRPWTLGAEHVEVRPLRGEIPTIDVGTVWRRGSGLKAVAGELIELARESSRTCPAAESSSTFDTCSKSPPTANAAVTPLSDHLVQRGAGPLIHAVLDVAYTIEFGREISRRSALAMLYFIAPNRGQALTPFGVFSDERLHIVEGNDTVATRMAAGLPSPVRLGHRLPRVARQADGRVRLSLATGSKTIDSVHDAVLLALPAPLVRKIDFAASAALPAGNRFAIDHFDYGSNSKMMIGFNGRPWHERSSGSNGASYSDLAKHQSTWETNPSLSQANTRGVLTDYSGGERGARLDPAKLQAEAGAFLTDLERVYPNSAVFARRDSKGRAQAHLENWSQLLLFKGAYSNNQPGYFTTLEGLYAKPAGNIYFAGEHTDSFYSYQGFMEGALLSGARAADDGLRGV